MADAGQDDLAACVARDQVSPALAERVAQLLASLAAADLAHRDLKASNVLIDEDGAPCLIDLDAMRERRGGDPRDVARLLANWAAQPLNASIQRLRDALVSTGLTPPAAGS
jgi:serine/threonine protein kinase